jgi:hypothetical protein
MKLFHETNLLISFEFKKVAVPHRITTAKTAVLKGSGVLCRAQLWLALRLSHFLRGAKIIPPSE